jgi:hypothetical protein
MMVSSLLLVVVLLRHFGVGVQREETGLASAAKPNRGRFAPFFWRENRYFAW